MSATIFTFDGHEFALANARLSASLADPVWCDKCNRGAGKALSWSLELEAADLEVDGEIIAPSIDINDLPIGPNCWHELAGQSTNWDTSIRPETDDRYGMTYVWDHELIRKARISIGKRYGSSFHISVVGENEDDQEFTVEAVVPFTGIAVNFAGADTADSVIARLALVLDTSKLKPGPFKSTGAKYNAGCMTFTPKVEA